MIKQRVLGDSLKVDDVLVLWGKNIKKGNYSIVTKITKTEIETDVYFSGVFKNKQNYLLDNLFNVWSKDEI